MQALFTPQELAELAAFDAEVDAKPLTNEEIRESRVRDRNAKYAELDVNREKIAEYQRAYREANREKAAEYQRAYREANREKIAEQRQARRKNGGCGQ